MLLAVAGCGGKEPPRYHVSGAVSYGGKPVPGGYILFQPDAGKGNTGPATLVQVEDGRYDTAHGGTGTVGGPHIAIVTGFADRSDAAPEARCGAPLFRDARIPIDLPKEAGVQDLLVPARQ